MDPGDPTSIIFKKIMSLEPEYYAKIIGYFLWQDMEQRHLISFAFGPDTLIQTFCRIAKLDLGLSSNDVSLNPISRPINIRGQSLSQPSPRNGFLEFSRNPNNSLPSLLTSNTLIDNPNFSSGPFRDGSSLFANQFPFLNNDDPFAISHKRSFSANDALFESKEPGFGGGGGGAGYHRFPQNGLVDEFGSSSGLGSPSEMDYLREEMMRMKLAQQKRMVAAQFMAASSSPMSHRQGSEQFGEEGSYYYCPSGHVREDSDKKIYLTFPSDSSFTDKDVSTYFSDFGPVENVRIPHQQQRMYGFVIFSNAETVRTVLARGNPHFICDSSVLVKPYKPYKEKGKILQKRQQQQLHQQLERGNYSPSSSPSGMDSRDLYDCRLGPRMFPNKTQEMLQRKTEQADLQQAIEVELQRRRLLNLQLPDMENKSIHYQQHSPFSPAHIPPRFDHNLLFHLENNNEEIMEGNSGRSEKHLQQVADSKEEGGHSNDFYKGQETSLENNLPDSLFGSPKKSDETRQTKSATEQNKEASSDQSA